MIQLTSFWPQSAVGRILVVSVGAVILGAAVLPCFAAMVFASYMTAGAAFVVGALVGCLFGVPQSNSAAPATDKEGTSAKVGLYRPSNQLQQVSDWLVKILLGASLTQLGNVTLIGTYFAPFAGSAAGAMVIVTYFFVVGFLSGYFVMIVYLGRLIRDAGDDLTGDRQRIEVEYELYQSLYGSSVDQDRAVKRAQEYLNEHPDGSADIFGHLACAYGQMYQRALDVPAATPADAEVKGLRDSAVKYAREATNREREWGGIFQDLYDAEPDDNDDDWAVFKQSGNDPDQTVEKFIATLRPRGTA